MSKYLVETFYTCTFKIAHKLEELNEKKLLELESRSDGKVEIIDVKLNNRKTRTINDKNIEKSLDETQTKGIPDISSLINEKIIHSDKLQNSDQFEGKVINKQSFTKKTNNR